MKKLRDLIGSAGLPSCVAVKKERKSFVMWVPSIVSLDGMMVVTVLEALECLEQVYRLRYYQFGSYFIEQLQGFPIGGPLSGTILHLCLSYLEWLFRFDIF